MQDQQILRQLREHRDPRLFGVLVERHRDPVARLDRARHVRDCLEELPPPYRAALRLFYWLDAPVDDIATLLGVSAGTVKSYLCRGRARLDRVLQRRGVKR